MSPKKYSSEISEARLVRLAARFMRALKVRGATLDIFLLPHREIKALKARVIKKKTEPNVLAFPEPTDFPHPDRRGKKYLGEVYLNKDILKKSPERTAPLLLHGILHLLGYDHIKGKDVKKMEDLEARILRKI